MPLGRGNNEINKIDKYATDGLLGVPNSLAYRIAELEKHFHTRERWFGVAASPSGTTHVADRLGPSINPFRTTAGNNTWGSWIQILGTSDTPQISGSAYFDPHRGNVVNADAVGAYFIQLAGGSDASQALTLGNYTEFVYTTASNQIDVGTLDVMARRQPVGTMAWIRIMVPAQSGKILDFYYGIHEYEG